MLAQAPLADFVLQRDLRAAIGSALDLGVLSGLGVGGEPLGLLENSAIPAPVTFAGAPTIIDVAAFEETVATADAETSSMAFVTTPVTRQKWRVTERAAGNGVLWPDGSGPLGRPGFATNNITGNRVLYGNFADLLIVLFGALEIMVDRTTAAKTDQVLFHVSLGADAGPLRVESFARSTDSGAQ